MGVRVTARAREFVDKLRTLGEVKVEKKGVAVI